eukprot:5792669-Prymnesium_polylepis.1
MRSCAARGDQRAVHHHLGPPATPPGKLPAVDNHILQEAQQVMRRDVWQYTLQQGLPAVDLVIVVERVLLRRAHLLLPPLPGDRVVH